MQHLQTAYQACVDQMAHLLSVPGMAKGYSVQKVADYNPHPDGATNDRACATKKQHFCTPPSFSNDLCVVVTALPGVCVQHPLREKFVVTPTYA